MKENWKKCEKKQNRISNAITLYLPQVDQYPVSSKQKMSDLSPFLLLSMTLYSMEYFFV